MRSDAARPALTARLPSPDAAGDAAPKPETWRFLGISAGAAPFLAVGPVADFTKIGVWSTLAVDLRFPLWGGILEAGILSGFCWFHAIGDVAAADIYFVPIGPDLRFALAAVALPALSFHLSGGPAIMTTVAAYTGTVVKAIPYVLGGIEIDLPFAPFLGLRIGAEYAALFEEIARPIMAFVPGVSMVLRF